MYLWYFTDRNQFRYHKLWVDYLHQTDYSASNLEYLKIRDVTHRNMCLPFFTSEKSIKDMSCTFALELIKYPDEIIYHIKHEKYPFVLPYGEEREIRILNSQVKFGNTIHVKFEMRLKSERTVEVSLPDYPPLSYKKWDWEDWGKDNMVIQFPYNHYKIPIYV